MRDKLKNLKNYIFRGWDEEPGYTHPLIKIIPPILIELSAYFLGLFILYQIGLYIYKLI
jgi:hypothetical protein